MKKQLFAVISHSHIEITRAQRVGEGNKFKIKKEINKIKEQREKIICNHIHTDNEASTLQPVLNKENFSEKQTDFYENLGFRFFFSSSRDKC